MTSRSANKINLTVSLVIFILYVRDFYYIVASENAAIPTLVVLIYYLTANIVYVFPAILSVIFRKRMQHSYAATVVLSIVNFFIVTGKQIGRAHV